LITDRTTMHPTLTPFSSQLRPAVRGQAGAVSAAHPLAVAAGQQVLGLGGTAADAVVAAQAVLTVVAPDACGLGGDGFALVRTPGEPPMAVNGAGVAPAGARQATSTGGGSVAMPGLVDAWAAMHRRWGRLPLADVLLPAIVLAERGVRADQSLLAARDAQRDRLLASGAQGAAVLHLVEGDRLVQPELARLLTRIADDGRSAFYEHEMAMAIVAAVRRAGGVLTEADLKPVSADVVPPIAISFAGMTIYVQPPMSQGVLLALSLHGWSRGGWGAGDPLDHLGVELTQAAFSLRDEVAEGEALLPRLPEIDPKRAQGRGGPRAYLHTAGVSAADGEGMVISSLVSVFDDFGSGVYVPEGGFFLNNRAGGFTGGANAFRPGARPVHTLAPALVEADNMTLALSTPGADGQVQTLLQVLLRWIVAGQPLAEAIAAPRWRSENGRLLVEAGHPARGDLAARGHEVMDGAAGDMRFGAITAAGLSQGDSFALCDWRRTTWAGVA
jgi:gamma-glutamyltranspeptidase/glutathione hydrolase